MLIVTMNIVTALASVGVDDYLVEDGSVSGFDGGASCDASDNDYWVLTSEGWAWERIEVLVFFEEEDILSKIQLDVDFNDFIGYDYEVWIYYSDDSVSNRYNLGEGSSSITPLAKSVKAIKIQEAQFGWFQLQVDKILGIPAN